MSVSSAAIAEVARREDNLITQIEKEALDVGASVAGALRKCVVLGGKSGSEPLQTTPVSRNGPASSPQVFWVDPRDFASHATGCSPL